MKQEALVHEFKGGVCVCVCGVQCVCVCMCQGRKVMRGAVDSKAGSFSSLFVALWLRKLSVCFYWMTANTQNSCNIIIYNIKIIRD